MLQFSQKADSYNIFHSAYNFACFSSIPEKNKSSRVSIYKFFKMNTANNYTYTAPKSLPKNFFPYELMGMLSSEYFADCLSWREDGEAFCFLHIDKFITKLQANNPRRHKYKKRSFIRKLNRWGFTMDRSMGPNYGMYANALFKRDAPWLCEKMACEKTSGAILMDKSSLDSEPREVSVNARYATSENLPCERNSYLERALKKRKINTPMSLSYDDIIHAQLLDMKLQQIEFLIQEKLRSLRHFAYLKTRF